MKEKIDKLLKEQRKTKVDLSILLGITPNGLQLKIANDTFKHNDIVKLEEFFGVEKGYFDKEPRAEVKAQPTMWEVAKEQYEARINEMSQALSDARYTIQLQRKMLEGKANFLNLSKKPPVKRAYLAGMYISKISLMRA
jgi:hypothetical protein